MSSLLEDFIARVDLAHDHPSSVGALASTVRDALHEVLSDDDFKLDCLERILRSPSLGNRKVPWTNPPIYVNDRLNYRFRIFFWLPGFVVAPHRHNTWGVTGVLHERSSVCLYRSEHDATSGIRRLIPERQFVARAGEAGYLVPPCTHSVGNPGKRVSATFHVFATSIDPEQRRDDTVWYPVARAKQADKPRYATLLGSTEMLAGIRSARSIALLERVFRIGDPQIRAASAKALAAIDPLHPLCTGGDARPTPTGAPATVPAY